MIFQNRAQAGEKLAAELLALELRDPMVFAIPRGGAPVAAAIGAILRCPVDVIPLIKVGIPWSPEASYGAVAADGTTALNIPLIRKLELSEREIELASARIMPEAQRRENLYRGTRPFPSVEGKSAVVVDDGLASGYSMLAAVRFLRKRHPRMIVAASPVSSDLAFRMLAALPELNLLIALVHDADQILSLDAYYRDFPKMTDDDVVRCLNSFGPR